MPDDSSRDTPPTRQARRRAQTRERLLDAAQALFARQRVVDTTISQITEEADVGFGSFYNHFASKDEIVEATVREYLRQQVRVVMGLVEKLNDPAETVAIAYHHFASKADDDGEITQLLLSLDASYKIMLEELGPHARNDIERGLASGRFTVSDPEVVLIASAGALIFNMRAVSEGTVGPEAAIEVAQLVLQLFGLTAHDAADVVDRRLRVGPGGRVHARATEPPSSS